MRAERAYPDIAELLRPLSEADIFSRPSSAVRQGALRLEAGFYGSYGFRALQAMEMSGFDIGRVGDVAEVRWFGPFSRTYVNDVANGVPFLSSSDMLMAKLEPKNLLSRALTSNLERLLVEEGTILVSCSGTIGNVAICTKDFNGVTVSQHAIRVDSKDDIDLGVLYAFLLSALGQFLITRNKSGSVIESIYAADVASLPIPILPKSLRCGLSDKIQLACDLRVKANTLLDQANKKVLAGIPGWNPPHQIAESTSFISSSLRLRGGRPYKGAIRLDATAHAPSAAEARDRIASTKHDVLTHLVKNILYIGKVYRNFVDDHKQGVPLLSGKDLIELRHRDSKYLSVLDREHIERCKLERGWILISRSGTIGRVAMCHRNFEGYVGSEDILRLIPDPTRIDPYFLAAFLSSPMGQSQIEALIYGSVIQHLSGAQLGSICVPIPNDKGASIGKLVRDAYDCRADAVIAENEAIQLFSNAIASGRDAIEMQWGKEY